MLTLNLMLTVNGPLQLTTLNSTLWLIRTISVDTLHSLPMLKCTLNSTLWLIHTKHLNFGGDELTVVDCMFHNTNSPPNKIWNLHSKEFKLSNLDLPLLRIAQNAQSNSFYASLSTFLKTFLTA